MEEEEEEGVTGWKERKKGGKIKKEGRKARKREGGSEGRNERMNEEKGREGTK
jgi:hypothetical protein